MWHGRDGVVDLTLCHKCGEVARRKIQCCKRQVWNRALYFRLDVYPRALDAIVIKRLSCLAKLKGSFVSLAHQQHGRHARRVNAENRCLDTCSELRRPSTQRLDRHVLGHNYRSPFSQTR